MPDTIQKKTIRNIALQKFLNNRKTYKFKFKRLKMWKPFSVSEDVYMLRLEENENNYTLLLTDLSSVWESKFLPLTLVNSFKENNPLIEATDEQITSGFLEITSNLKNANISVKTLDTDKELILAKSCTDLHDYVKNQKIVYKFRLEKKRQDEFTNIVTVPAVQTIYFLEKQQQMLLNLVQKKDRELEEFRMEKGEISRGDLKTEKFDGNILNPISDKLLINVFTGESSKDFWLTFSRKNGELQTTSLYVEPEPWNTRSRKRVTYSGKKVVKKGSGVVFNK